TLQHLAQTSDYFFVSFEIAEAHCSGLCWRLLCRNRPAGQIFVHCAHDLCVHLPDRPSCINRDHAFPVSLGNIVIGGVHSSEERAAFALEAILILSVGGGSNIP